MDFALSDGERPTSNARVQDARTATTTDDGTVADGVAGPAPEAAELPDDEHAARQPEATANAMIGLASRRPAPRIPSQSRVRRFLPLATRNDHIWTYKARGRGRLPSRRPLQGKPRGGRVLGDPLATSPNRI